MLVVAPGETGRMTRKKEQASMGRRSRIVPAPPAPNTGRLDAQQELGGDLERKAEGHQVEITVSLVPNPAQTGGPRGVFGTQAHQTPSTHL